MDISSLPTAAGAKNPVELEIAKAEKVRSLLLILIFTFIGSGMTILIMQRVQTYHRDQIYLATEAALPVHKALKDNQEVKVYRDEAKKYQFQYSGKLRLKSESGEVILYHSIPYKNYGSCDMAPSEKQLDNLEDFKVSINLTDKSMVEAVKQESPYIPEENFASGTLKISPGFIDSFNMGVFKGYTIYEAVEGCGHIVYYIAINSQRTLIIKKDIIQVLSGILSSEIMQEVLRVPGVISPEESETIFLQVLKSFSID